MQNGPRAVQLAHPRAIADALPTRRPCGDSPLHRGTLRLTALVVAVAHHVDHDRAGENENSVLAVGDIDAVGIRPAEPLLRYRRDDAISTSECVLAVQEGSLSLEVIGAGYVDCESMVDEREELALDHGEQVRATPQLVGRTPVEQPLIDEHQLVSLRILKGKLGAEAEELALHEIHILLVFIFDRKGIREREKLLTHYVAHRFLRAAWGRLSRPSRAYRRTSVWRTLK